MERTIINRMPTDVDGKIKLALYLLNNEGRIPYDKVKFILIYTFTTEDLCEAFGCLDFNQKVVATVGSSGDQPLNAIYLGSSKVYVVDICPFSKDFFYMKSGALYALSREDLLSFFGQPGHYFSSIKPLDKRAWLKVCKCISDEEVKYFWSYLFERFPGGKIWKSLFDVSDAPRIGLARRINPYLLSDESYDKMKKILPNASVEFAVKDIFDGGIDANNPVDILYLSNLITYCSPKKIADLCETEIKHLSDDGVIVASYLYNGLWSAKSRELYEILCKNYRTEFCNFPSNVTYDEGDGLILVRTRKRT